uniref:D5 N terminal like protein n=1 Tax=Megaviridae environmental sample TaxID=1737588 RepID=A0A5J6VKF8_9VIRU|nr:MAG: D5 N terminal like protein [Megaviridae environmental sample]
MSNSNNAGNNEVTKKYTDKFNIFLEQFRTTGKQIHFTHVSLGGLLFPGKFNIPDKKNRSKLVKHLARAIQNNIIFSMAEMPLEYGPPLIDMDFKFPEDQVQETFGNVHIYSMDLIKQIIEYYQSALSEYLDLDDDKLDCFLFEKSKGKVKNGEYKDGVHIIFPYICINSKLRQLVYNKVKNLAVSNECFDIYSNPDSVLDDAVVNTNAWMMYGCSKPNNEPYILTHIYGKNNVEKNISTLGPTENIIKMLQISDNKKWDEQTSSKLKEGLENSNIDEEYENLGLNKTVVTKHVYDIPTADNLENIEKAMILVDLLNKKRCDDRTSWINVGWALHNTDPSLLDTWVQFSKQSKKFKEGECETEWDRMRNDGLTIRSLCLWAKEDSPVKFAKFQKESINKLLIKNDLNNTYMVAKALQYQYMGRFVCTDTSRDGSWYEFKNHRWRKCQSGGSLIVLMSSEFANIYSDKASEVSIASQSAEGSEKKVMLQQVELFNKIAQKLMDISFKKKIIEESKNLFLDDMFLDKLDENYNLIGFENGVYDLKAKKFRAGHPDDYISLSTKNKFHNWSDKNPYSKPIKNFFEQVLVNENVRKFFLQRISTCMSGENREEKFYFCTGSGSNGKSLTFQLVSDALGEYYLSCPITIITKKRNASNAASPELARLKGARAGIFQEPGHQEEINIGIFKELTGNDKIMVRGLYKEPIEIKPQTKYWCCCNDLPAITSDDGGTWRRVMVVDFSSKFVDSPTKSNEFKIDTKLKNKIKNWAPAFASYLIHIYNTEYNVPNKSSEPEEVKISTGKYRQNQDIIREFFDNCLEKTSDENDKLKKTEISKMFNEWFKSDYDGITKPKRSKIWDFLEEELEQKYTQSGYKFIKFKNTTDSDVDSEED